MNPKKNDLFPKTILIFSTIIIIFIIISFGLQYSNQKKYQRLELDKKIAETEIHRLEIEKYSYTPTPTPTPRPISFAKVYNLRFKIVNSEKIYDNIPLELYGKQLFVEQGYPASLEDFRIYISPSNTNNYLFFFNLDNYEPPATYKNDAFEISLTPNKSINLNYLVDKSYCQIDDDCQIRRDRCSYGAFNKYQESYPAYGCEGNIYDYQSDYYFGPYDKILKCNSEVKYQTTECINNKCTGTDRSIECVGKLEIHP